MISAARRMLYLVVFVTVRVAVILLVFRACGLLVMTLACWNKICMKLSISSLRDCCSPFKESHSSRGAKATIYRRNFSIADVSVRSFTFAGVISSDEKKGGKISRVKLAC